MYFGPLRSLLQISEPTQSSFDDVLRHLLNWSWGEDPRVFEECLAYAHAGLRRWPDEARGLFVTNQEEVFLEHIFAWEPLLRALSLTKTPRFVGRVLEAIDAGELKRIRYLHLHQCGVSRDQAARLGAGLPALEGLSFFEENPAPGVVEALLEAAPGLRWLCISGRFWRVAPYIKPLQALSHLGYLRVPWEDEDLEFLTSESLPTLQTLDACGIDPRVMADRAFCPPRSGVVLTGVDARFGLEDVLASRGWVLEEEPNVPFLAKAVSSPWGVYW